MISLILILIGGATMVVAYFLAERMLRVSEIEELKILLETSTADWFLSSRWGEDEFPEFFRTKWADDKNFYMKLMKSLRKSRYGGCKKLLRNLIRIENKRQRKKMEEMDDDEEYTIRIRTLLETYKRREDFAAVLGAFMEKKYLERMKGETGS